MTFLQSFLLLVYARSVGLVFGECDIRNHT